MIIKRVFVIIKNLFTLIHYGLKYLSIRALEIIEGPSRIRMRLRDYQKHLKSTIDYRRQRQMCIRDRSTLHISGLR